MCPSRVAEFVRECCGCRVSSVMERQVKLQTKYMPSYTRTFFIPEIHACQCIPCDAKVYNWANYFLVMSHMVRK
ncbi:hypothetical protein EGW08_018309 [Elysia chlorotica]|uniref:CTCK domain-containing protein n=1 Tax=Elysia chlorotica TaxID=188477 RepID=A0A3S0Z9R3_ELYCH|nr:hypothetical protein EGW08_018309 [Elysia chlorotica]